MQKERVLQDLTDSLLRVVSGRPSRRNSGELEAIKKALAAELRGKKKEKAEPKGNAQKQAKKGKQASKVEEAEPESGQRKTRKRNEEQEPPQHAPAKRARTGK